MDRIELKMKTIETKLDKLETILLELTNKVDNLNVTLNGDLVPECKKMGSHIDFVENVYETVKYPMLYLCNQIKRIAGTNVEEFEMIEN